MAYRYPSVLPGGGCSAGACSSNSRPCTPNKKIIKSLTLDFSGDTSLTGTYVVQTGAPIQGFFATILVPTGPGGVVSQRSLIPASGSLLSASYSDASHNTTTSGGLFSAELVLNPTGAPAGYNAVQIAAPTGAFAAAQKLNGPTGTFVIYYI
jgi:hypothetical protein